MLPIAATSIHPNNAIRNLCKPRDIHQLDINAELANEDVIGYEL
jgi:hypothetical protein